jgi:hypothetical protein
MILTVAGPSSMAEWVNSKEFTEVERPGRCPAGCGSPLWRHTGYARRATDGDGKVVWIWIPRFRCGECKLVVSCLFDFLVPYVIYSVQAIAAWVGKYSQDWVTYDDLAWKTGSLEVPRSSVFRRVAICVEQAEILSREFQGEAMLNRCEDMEMDSRQATCPNASKAHTAKKASNLNRAVTLLASARLLLRKAPETGQGILVLLHRYFMSTSEELRSIFFQRKDLALSNQQSPRCIIF